MNTPTQMYDMVPPTPGSHLDDTVPVHLFVAAANAQGSVMCNVEARLVVLNLGATDDVSLALELADFALNEMEAVGTGTLIYDTRSKPDVVSSRVDSAVKQRVLDSMAVTCLAMLTAPGSGVAEAPAVQQLLSESKVDVIRANEFADLMNILQASNPVLASACTLIPEKGADFIANYGGSVFSVPELSATVIRTSGEGANSKYMQAIVQKALGVHIRNQSSVLIFDTSDSPLLPEGGQYFSLPEALIARFASCGLASTMAFVRLEEISTGSDGISFETTCAKWGVFGFESRTPEEALSLVRVLKGCATKSSLTFPGVTLARI